MGAGEKIGSIQKDRLFCAHLFYFFIHLHFTLQPPGEGLGSLFYCRKVDDISIIFLATDQVTLILDCSQSGDCDIFHCCVCHIRGNRSSLEKHAIAPGLCVCVLGKVIAFIDKDKTH